MLACRISFADVSAILMAKEQSDDDGYVIDRGRPRLLERRVHPGQPRSQVDQLISIVFLEKLVLFE